MTYKPTIFEFVVLWHLLLPLDLRNGYIGKRGHGQADRTRRARAAMEKTDSFGKDGYKSTYDYLNDYFKIITE